MNFDNKPEKRVRVRFELVLMRIDRSTIFYSSGASPMQARPTSV
jgi:hypothetical protein